MPLLSDRLILLTGASGYVGGRLLRRLQTVSAPVRCMTRRPEVLSGRVQRQTEVIEADGLIRESLGPALEGVHTACYLVHSMGGPGDFEDHDRRAALNFAEAAQEAGVEQIV